jgi:hypothetical protein
MLVVFVALIKHLGDQISIADLHLAAWLAQVVALSGGQVDDEGDVAIAKIESRIGPDFHFVRGFATFSAAGGGHPAYQSNLAVFWDAMRERSSFKNVYTDGLY